MFVLWLLVNNKQQMPLSNFCYLFRFICPVCFKFCFAFFFFLQAFLWNVSLICTGSSLEYASVCPCKIFLSAKHVKLSGEVF